MDKRIILLIGIFLIAIIGFVVFRKLSGSKKTVAINYSLKNIKNEIGYKDSSIQFADLTEGAIAWQWNFGDDGYATDQEPTHVYSNSGNYKVILTVTVDGTKYTDSSKSIEIKDNLNDTTVVVSEPIIDTSKKSVTIPATPKAFTLQKAKVAAKPHKSVIHNSSIKAEPEKALHNLTPQIIPHK
jgi:hypothetical protein